MAKSRSKQSSSLWMRGFVGLVYGYFFTYCLGSMFIQLNHYTDIHLFMEIGEMLVGMKTVGVAVGVAGGVQASSMGLLASVIVGLFFQNQGPFWMLVVYLVVLICQTLANRLYNHTPFDLFLIPAVCLILCECVLWFVMPLLNHFGGWMINQLVDVSSFSPLVITLLMPILSTIAALLPVEYVVSFQGIAGISCLMGAISLMLGLAVMSAKENSMGDVIAVMLGTARLQLTNVLRHPIILLPPMISAIVTTWCAYYLFHLEVTGTYLFEGLLAFRGLEWLVLANGIHTWPVAILLLMISALTTYGLFQAMLKAGWIHTKDLKIEKL